MKVVVIYNERDQHKNTSIKCGVITRSVSFFCIELYNDSIVMALTLGLAKIVASSCHIWPPRLCDGRPPACGSFQSSLNEMRAFSGNFPSQRVQRKSFHFTLVHHFLYIVQSKHISGI